MTIGKASKLAQTPSEGIATHLCEDAKSPIHFGDSPRLHRLITRADTPGTFATDEPMSPNSLCHPFSRRDCSPKPVPLDYVASRFLATSRSADSGEWTPTFLRLADDCAVSCSSSLTTPRSTLKFKPPEDPDAVLKAVVEEHNLGELEPVMEEEGTLLVSITSDASCVTGVTSDTPEVVDGKMLDDNLCPDSGSTSNVLPFAVTPQGSMLTFSQCTSPDPHEVDRLLLRQEIAQLKKMRTASKDCLTASTQTSYQESPAMVLNLDHTLFGSPRSDNFIEIVPGALPLPESITTPTSSLENNFAVSPSSKGAMSPIDKFDCSALSRKGS